jgi:hypothetical protein
LLNFAERVLIVCFYFPPSGYHGNLSSLVDVSQKSFRSLPQGKKSFVHVIPVPKPDPNYSGDVDQGNSIISPLVAVDANRRIIFRNGPFPASQGGPERRLGRLGRDQLLHLRDYSRGGGSCGPAQVLLSALVPVRIDTPSCCSMAILTSCLSTGLFERKVACASPMKSNPALVELESTSGLFK